MFVKIVPGKGNKACGRNQYHEIPALSFPDNKILKINGF